MILFHRRYLTDKEEMHVELGEPEKQGGGPPEARAYNGSGMAKIGKPVCVAPTGDRCGEGAVWHEGESALYWCDINRCLIHRFDEKDRHVKSWLFEEPVTALALTDRDDTLAVALGSCLIFWKPDLDTRQNHVFRLPGWPNVRLNDGRPDPRGSFWVGSMRNNVTPDGTAWEAGGTDGILFRIDADGTISEWRRDIGISNTLTWNPAEDRFYFADTLANEVRVYDYNKETGAIGRERPFLKDFPRGKPDGSAMDAKGYLWNCRYGGGCIVRVEPEGKIDCVIDMPVTNITTCTFGGPDLTTLYITTAANGAGAGERLAGSLFAIETDVKGQRENRFRAHGS
jgi:sugar lactone lactonase YvrE